MKTYTIPGVNDFWYHATEPTDPSHVEIPNPPLRDNITWDGSKWVDVVQA